MSKMQFLRSLKKTSEVSLKTCEKCYFSTQFVYFEDVSDEGSNELP